MKNLFLLSFLAFTSMNAHHPAINYALISEWCQSIQKLDQDSLKTMQTYLHDLEAYATCFIANTQCLNTPQGKELQSKLDQDVANIMKNHALIPVFEQLTMLIKEEVGQDKFTMLGQQHKKEYELLAAVVKGCLECVERKLT